MAAEESPCYDVGAAALQRPSGSTPQWTQRHRGLSQRTAPAPGCGFTAGLAVTALLNPWDRALFLSLVQNRPFLRRENWRHPYRGLSQTLVQRSISSGLFFPLEHLFSQRLGSTVLGGQAAAVFLGITMNPLNYIRYQSWGAEKGRSFFTTARRAHMDAGSAVFLRGLIATTFRDATFGFVFSLRKVVPVEPGPNNVLIDFAVATVAAAAGTALSSPFNYIRNMEYAEKTSMPLESLRSKYAFWQAALAELASEARGQRSAWAAARALHDRLRLGWGTARVAVGMSLTEQLYVALRRRNS